jgi:hypothetical protein
MSGPRAQLQHDRWNRPLKLPFAIVFLYQSSGCD